MTSRKAPPAWSLEDMWDEIERSSGIWPEQRNDQSGGTLNADGTEEEEKKKDEVRRLLRREKTEKQLRKEEQQKDRERRRKQREKQRRQGRAPTGGGGAGLDFSSSEEEDDDCHEHGLPTGTDCPPCWGVCDHQGRPSVWAPGRPDGRGLGLPVLQY